MSATDTRVSAQPTTFEAARAAARSKFQDWLSHQNCVFHECPDEQRSFDEYIEARDLMNSLRPAESRAAIEQRRLLARGA